ncbi:MAG TPA: rifamycin-inactivating phosphotransferase [Kofleriaceae bacterium]|jgi:pyruvate,water dikinase
MTTYALAFQDIDRSASAIVGGKGANLGELARIAGVHVPDGFCVTTDAFRAIARDHRELDGLLGELARLPATAQSAIRETSARIRAVIEATAMPAAVASAIAEHVEGHAYAVRSSATAEDLPTASFAGQHDTYLNVVGADSVLAHVRRCWASLFTDRAVAYRLQHRIDHRRVEMAVVIQRMVFPEVAGILFTADPITSNRRVSSIDASFGLGEAVVSGLVNADTYRVRDGAIVDKQISAKQRMIVPASGGGTAEGTIERAIEPERQHDQALSDAQIVSLERLGRTIEAHFGSPQDIEWCLAGGELFIVQSRPITTLYPIPDATDQAPHVYISVGHAQMMTDAMRPLGLSFWLMTTPASMRTAGGRLFVDVAPMLASPARAAVVDTLGQGDPLVKDALTTILDRGFVPPAPPTEKPAALRGVFGPPQPIDDDPAIVAGLIERSQASIAAMQREIGTKSGPALFDFILRDIDELKRQLHEPQSIAAIRAGMGAAAWLNEHVKQWLGDTNAADALSQSAPNNITSEMGLALLDVADAIRPYPQVVAYLQHARDDTFFDGLATLDGGPEAGAALGGFLVTYGMRCAGEIDVTRTRWAESPTTLVPLILGNVKMFAPGESRRRFEHGRRGALAKERDVLERLRQLPDGEHKATDTQQAIRRLRIFIGYREYPKYAMVQRYFEYRKAILREAARLAHDAGDVYFLTFAELAEVVRTGVLDARIVDERRAAYAFYDTLAPPRVMTSEGEIVRGSYQRAHLPAGALVGLPVSTGVIEGRARVVARMADAVLEPGDILVTAFTDPSWTPLFVSIKGLVTEVGGLMTHGAVIAREYGLPAVVGVEGATARIADGQRIRVNGTDGYVELLDPGDPRI